jgi:precorrin-2 dehydrogenase / sirohydrochlorin ferrochelatase
VTAAGGADALGLPLMAELAGRRAVVVGAGPVAERKLHALLAAGADVLVVAPEAVEGIRAHADAGALRWEPRPFAADDLAGTWLAVAATADEAVNDEVAAEAERRRVWCVRTDGGGSAALMGVVRRGPLTLAVSTGGASPALARQLRAELAETYGEEHGRLAELLGELRADPAVRTVLDGLEDTEKGRRWRRVLAADILTPLRNGRPDLAKELALACLSSSSD